MKSRVKLKSMPAKEREAPEGSSAVLDRASKLYM